jgi:thioredoxin 2
VLVSCPACSRSNRLPAQRIKERAKCAACKAPLLPLARPLPLHDAADFDELIGSAPLPVLVDFWAAWCGPCRAVAPELERLANSRAGSLIVAKVDTDALPELAARYRIQSIPTMILFRDGRVGGRLSGAMSAASIASELAL